MAKLNRLKTTREVGKLVDDYWAELRNAHAEGRKVVWTCGPPSSQMIFASQGIRFHYAEPFGAYVSGRHWQEPFLAACEDLGYNADVCGYEKISFGHIQLSRTGRMKEIDPMYDLPQPDAAFTARCCPNHAAFVDAVGRIYDVPTIQIDVPYHYATPEEYKESMNYIKRQIYDSVIPFIEKLNGKKFDMDAFSEYMATLQKAVKCRQYFMDISKLKPSPLTFFDTAISLAMVVTLAGRPETVPYSEKMQKEVEERVANGIGAISEERHRLYWDHIAIWYKMSYLSNTLAEHGCNIVVANYTHGEGFPRLPETFDPADPVNSMADFLIVNNRCALPEYKMDWLLKAAKEYDCDGAIFHNNRTCRYFAMDTYTSAQELEKMGIPSVIIDADTCDPQFLNEAQMETKLEAFFEVLENRGKVKA